jgi:hypothetical protein
VTREMLLIGFAVVALLAGTARAEDRVAAERSFRAAERAYKAQNFEAAVHHYEAAYKELPLPEIAFSAAQAYRKQYRVNPKLEYLRRAIALYEIYLGAVKTGGRVSDAADNLGEMKLELSRLEPTPAGVPVPVPVPEVRTRTQLAISPQVESERSGAMREVSERRDEALTNYAVTIDGKAVQPFVPIELEPGPHAIRVEATGYVPVETTGRAIEGVSDVVEVVLVPKPARVAVKTERGARVLVNGRPVGKAPLGAFEVPAGRHVVTIMRDGRRTEQREIVVARGEQLDLRQPLHKTVQRRLVPWVGLASGSLGVLAIGCAIFAGVEDGRARDNRVLIDMGDGSAQQIDGYNAAIRNRGRFTTAAIGNGGLAVVGGLVTAGLYWFDRPNTSSLRLTPLAGSGTGGLSLTGRW